MDALKAKISEARAELAKLRAGEQTAENAAKIVALRAQIRADQAELDVLVKAFEEDDEVDTEPVATKVDEVEPGKDANDVQPDEQIERPDTVTPTPVDPNTKPGKGDVTGDEDDEDGEDAGSGADATGKPVALAASGAGSDVSPTAGGGNGRELRPMTLTASGSAGGAGIRPGTELDREAVGRVLQAAATAAGAGAGRTRILEIGRWGDDENVLSDANTPIANSRLIAQARAAHAKGEGTRPVALTAAGCFCGPDELIRETGVVGRRGRPFAALFPSMPINGGFRAMPDLAFNVDTGLRAGVSQWTCADQAAVTEDPTTWKPCAEIDCFTEETYVPYAVEACVTVERFHRWAHPEQIDAWINLLGIEYDSLAETLLIDKVEADAGTPLTVGAAGGLMEDHGLLAKLIYALGSLSFSLGYQFREGEGVLEGYTLSVPVGMAEAVLADEQIRGFPTNIRTKQELLARLEQSYGVRMVERLDESTSRKAAAIATVNALNAGGAIDAGGIAPADTPLLPDTFRMYLIPTAGYVHAEGVMVGADWHVDDKLLRQNRMRYFLENVELLENLSVRKPHIIDVPGRIMGSYSDLVPAPHTV